MSTMKIEMRRALEALASGEINQPGVAAARFAVAAGELAKHLENAGTNVRRPDREMLSQYLEHVDEPEIDDFEVVSAGGRVGNSEVRLGKTQLVICPLGVEKLKALAPAIAKTRQVDIAWSAKAKVIAIRAGTTWKLTENKGSLRTSAGAIKQLAPHGKYTVIKSPRPDWEVYITPVA